MKTDFSVPAKGIARGILWLILLCGIAVWLLISVDLLYQADIILLDIPAQSGFSEEVVLRNYRAAVDYLNPFRSGDFTLPDLAVSENGAVHFRDVKNITNTLFLLSTLSLAVLLCWRVPKSSKIQRFAGLTILLFPILTGSAIITNAEGAFVLFHKIFFSNDYWIFDWNTDQIIRILPMDFFMHCAAVIVFFWLAAAAFLLVRYSKSER